MPTRPEPKSRAFLADAPILPGARDGKPGFSLTVRLTSCRSLPLSCIEDVRLTIDVETVAPERITLVLNGSAWPLSALGGLSQVWWWILDYGELFVASDAPLAGGVHDVEATLVTVEPYVTADRFSFFNGCRRQLARL